MSYITVHILDRDPTRRSAVARRVFTSGMHAEIYEDLWELTVRQPGPGVLLAFDDQQGPHVADIIASMEDHGFFMPVAMYSTQAGPEQIVAAMLSGALDYLVWPVEGEVLARSLGRLDHSGHALVVKRRKEAAARALVARLSVRETEVLSELVNGSSNKEVGHALGISPRTAEIHRSNILRKLGAASSADALRIGLFAGLD